MSDGKKKGRKSEFSYLFGDVLSDDQKQKIREIAAAKIPAGAS